MRVSSLLCVLFLSCGGPQQARIESIQDDKQLRSLHQISLVGVRDGDILYARLILSSSSLRLHMKMRFRIGMPTRLEDGNYLLEEEHEIAKGSITASSVTFLGGQSDRPHLGGVFRLLSSQGVPIYKVTVPTSEVARPLDDDFETIPPTHLMERSRFTNLRL